MLNIYRKVAFLLSTIGQKSQNMVVTHPFTPLPPPPPIFCRHSLQLLSPTLPKLMNWILFLPSLLSSDPNTPSKFGTCTKCHSDSSSAYYFCYSQQHIVSSNPYINNAHSWKEQDSHTSRNEHCKQALLAPSLH